MASLYSPNQITYTNLHRWILDIVITACSSQMELDVQESFIIIKIILYVLYGLEWTSVDSQTPARANSGCDDILA